MAANKDLLIEILRSLELRVEHIDAVLQRVTFRGQRTETSRRSNRPATANQVKNQYYCRYNKQ